MRILFIEREIRRRSSFDLFFIVGRCRRRRGHPSSLSFARRLYIIYIVPTIIKQISIQRTISLVGLFLSHFGFISNWWKASELFSGELINVCVSLRPIHRCIEIVYRYQCVILIVWWIRDFVCVLHLCTLFVHMLLVYISIYICLCVCVVVVQRVCSCNIYIYIYYKCGYSNGFTRRRIWLVFNRQSYNFVLALVGLSPLPHRIVSIPSIG